MIKVDIEGRSVDVPASWDECNIGQLSIAHSILSRTDVPVHGLMLGLVAGFLRVSGEWMLAHLDENQLAALMATVEGFFESEESDDDEEVRVWSVAPTLSECPYPEMRYGDAEGACLYAPSKGMGNITFYEFAMISDLLNASEANMPRVLAVLFRAGKPDTEANRRTGFGGDRRVALRGAEAMIERRQKHIEALPEIVKSLLGFWVRCCRAQLARRYAKVFTQSGGAATGTDFGWGGALLSLAGSPGLDALSSMSDTNVHNVLIHLTQQEDARRDSERRARAR